MNNALEGKVRTADALLREAALRLSPAGFSTSLGAEDMVVTDLICRAALPVDIFTLDTGRLPAETYSLIEAVTLRYGIGIRVVFPHAGPIESYVTKHGINAFYGSVELRKKCCHIRKVEPLKRALVGKKAWITGLRREQAVTRASLEPKAFDADFRLVKFNPLVDWSHEDVWAYIRTHNVPYHPLHDRGFPSIGCAPCTRAIAPGEDVRAGRWWWESPESKECGLHVRADGRLERVKEPA
jgi:phosphoadenosine phosphosulfate reductase